MSILKNRELLIHQKIGTKFALKNKHTILAFKAGTGKTSIALAFSQFLLIKEKVDISIIVGTAKSIIPIEAECKEFLDFYQRVSSKDKNNLDRLKNYSGILLCKYSEVPKVQKFLLKYQKSFAVVFDECHTIKTPTTKVTKQCKSLKKLALYSLGLTATPLKRNINDLYHIISFFNPNILGSYENFLNNYTIYYTIPIRTKTGYETKHYNPTKFKNLDKLRKVCENTLLSYFPDDDIQYINEYVELSNRTDYNNILVKVLETKEEDLFSPHPPEAMILLQNYLNNRKVKVLKLLELVKSFINEGLIIFCNNYQELELLEKVFDKCKYSYKSYTGKLNEKQAKNVANWFIENPEDKILLITQAGGQSINFQVVRRLIFYSLPFSIGALKQIEGRITRLGSKYQKFFIYRIITKETIEEYKLTYLLMFREIYEKVLGCKSSDKTKTLPSMNRYLLKQLAKDTIWN